MVTALHYQWLAGPWECFNPLCGMIGRWAVCGTVRVCFVPGYCQFRQLGAGEWKIAYETRKLHGTFNLFIRRNRWPFLIRFMSGTVQYEPFWTNFCNLKARFLFKGTRGSPIEGWRNSHGEPVKRTGLYHPENIQFLNPRSLLLALIDEKDLALKTNCSGSSDWALPYNISDLASCTGSPVSENCT